MIQSLTLHTNIIYTRLSMHVYLWWWLAIYNYLFFIKYIPNLTRTLINSQMKYIIWAQKKQWYWSTCFIFILFFVCVKIMNIILLIKLLLIVIWQVWTFSLYDTFAAHYLMILYDFFMYLCLIENKV